MSSSSLSSSSLSSTTCWKPERPVIINQGFGTATAIVPTDKPAGTLILNIWSDDPEFSVSYVVSDTTVEITGLPTDIPLFVQWSFDDDECSTDSDLGALYLTSSASAYVNSSHTCVPGPILQDFLVGDEGQCDPPPVTFYKAPCTGGDCPPGEETTFTLHRNSSISSLASESSRGSLACVQLRPDHVQILTRFKCGFRLRMPALPEDAEYLGLYYCEYNSVDGNNPQGPWLLYHTPSNGLPGYQQIITSDLEPGKKYWFKAVAYNNGFWISSTAVGGQTEFCEPVFGYNAHAEPVSETSIKITYRTYLLSPANRLDSILSLEKTAQNPDDFPSSWALVRTFDDDSWDNVITEQLSTGLTANTRYWYRFCATTNSGADKVCGDYFSAVTYPFIPNKPGFILFDNPGDTYHTISVKNAQPAVDSTHHAATFFQIGQRLSGETEWNFLTDENNVIVRVEPYDVLTYSPENKRGGWIVTGLTPDTIYEYALFAGNNNPVLSVLGERASIRTEPEIVPTLSSSSASSDSSLSSSVTSSSVSSLPSAQVIWLNPRSTSFPRSEEPTQSSSSASYFPVTGIVQQIDEDDCYTTFTCTAAPQGGSEPYSVVWEFWAGYSGLGTLEHVLVGETVTARLVKGYDREIRAVVTDNNGEQGFFSTLFRLDGGGTDCASSFSAWVIYPSFSSNSIESVESSLSSSSYPYWTDSVDGIAGEYCPPCGSSPSSSSSSSVTLSSSSLTLSEEGCIITAEVVGTIYQYKQYTLSCDIVGKSYEWQIQPYGTSNTVRSYESGFNIHLDRFTKWTVYLTVTQEDDTVILCSLIIDTDIPTISSSSSRSSSSNSSSSPRLYTVHGRVGLNFEVLDSGEYGEVWIEANGLRIPNPQQKLDDTWYLLWDTRDFGINGNVTLKAYAVGSDGIIVSDTLYLYLNNVEQNMVLYQDIGPVGPAPTGYLYSHVHFGIDVFPLAASPRRRFWLEVGLRTSELPNLYGDVIANAAGIQTQWEAHQLLALGRGAQHNGLDGEVEFDQWWAAAALTNPGANVTARIKLTPQEILTALETGCEKIVKIRKTEVGKYEIFCTGPARLFTYDGTTLELVEFGNLSDYGAGDAVDAGVVNDKIYVIRNQRLGSEDDEFFAIDKDTGEAEAILIPRRVPGRNERETRIPTLLEHVGDDLIVVFTDPDRESPVSSSSSSSAIYNPEQGNNEKKTAIYHYNGLNIDLIKEIDFVIEKTFVEGTTANVITYTAGPRLWQSQSFIGEPIFSNLFESNITAVNTLQVGLENGQVWRFFSSAWNYDSSLPNSPVDSIGLWYGSTVIPRVVAAHNNYLYAQNSDLGWGLDEVLTLPYTTVNSSSSMSSASSSSMGLDLSKITVIGRYENGSTEKLMLGTGNSGLLYILSRSNLSEATGAVPVTTFAVPDVYPFNWIKGTTSSAVSSSRSSRTSALPITSSSSLVTSSSSSSSSTRSLSSLSSSSVSSTSLVSSSSTISSSSMSSIASEASINDFINIVQGGYQSFPTQRGDSSALSYGWAIYDPEGTLVGEYFTPNGWDVEADTEYVTLHVPANAAAGQAYLIKKLEFDVVSDSSWSYAYFNVVSVSSSSSSSQSSSSS